MTETGCRRTRRYGRLSFTGAGLRGVGVGMRGSGAGGVDRVPIHSPLRTLAALIRARWLNACGKLPTRRPAREVVLLGEQTDIVTKREQPLEHLPRVVVPPHQRIVASASQNEQARNAPSLPERPSSVTSVE